MACKLHPETIVSRNLLIYSLFLFNLNEGESSIVTLNNTLSLVLAANIDSAQE